ncbi:aminoglycoside phosphotransferase family protein [Gemmatimonadota bacterium]
MRLPPDFVDRINTVHGERGRVWLADLPRRLTEACERFGLRELEVFPDLSHHVVARAETHEGRPVVVKAGPGREELAAEACALDAFGPTRAVDVLARWPEEGILLLEEVLPGHRLSEQVTEAEAAEVLGGLMAEGWPTPEGASMCYSSEDWMKGLREYASWGGRERQLIDPVMAERALRLLDDLEQSKERDRVLHGDLHYDNVLLSEDRGYLVIDPKGVIGDPAFYLGYLVTRPEPRGKDHPSLREAVSLRLAVLPSVTGEDPKRVTDHAFVAGVLSAVWALEDGSLAWRAVLEAARLVRDAPGR